MIRYLIGAGSTIGILLAGNACVEHLSSKTVTRYYFRHMLTRNKMKRHERIFYGFHFAPFMIGKEKSEHLLDKMFENVEKSDNELEVPEGYYLDTKVVTFYEKTGNDIPGKDPDYLSVENYDRKKF
jgi:hypothetical protein